MSFRSGMHSLFLTFADDTLEKEFQCEHDEFWARYDAFAVGANVLQVVVNSSRYLWTRSFQRTLDILVWAILPVSRIVTFLVCLLVPQTMLARYRRYVVSCVRVSRVLTYSACLVWGMASFSCSTLRSAVFLEVTFSSWMFPLFFKLAFRDHLILQVLTTLCTVLLIGKRGGICQRLAAGQAEAKCGEALSFVKAGVSFVNAFQSFFGVPTASADDHIVCSQFLVFEATAFPFCVSFVAYLTEFQSRVRFLRQRRVRNLPDMTLFFLHNIPLFYFGLCLYWLSLKPLVQLLALVP